MFGCMVAFLELFSVPSLGRKQRGWQMASIVAISPTSFPCLGKITLWEIFENIRFSHLEAIDKLPLIPTILEFIGILFSWWFIYRYLLFKPDRPLY
ncbi:hypothetical protein AAC387_Pa03g3419 [Persea americana]